MALTVFPVAADPKTFAATAAANVASPAVVFGIEAFDGPKLLAKPALPFSSPNANTSPSASLATAIGLSPCWVAKSTWPGRNWVLSKLTSEEVPTTPYIDASTATAGIDVLIAC